MEKSTKIDIIEPICIDIDLIEENRGQLDGIPANPRTIEPEDFEILKRSITDNPEMLGLKELYVKRNGSKYVVIDGNMRLKALRAVGHSTAVCKVIPEDFDAEQIKAVIIKSNISNGDWDTSMLMEDWDTEQLIDWGLDMKESFSEDEKDDYKAKGDDQSNLIKNSFSVEVVCSSEREQEQVFNELKSKGYTCRVLTF